MKSNGKSNTNNKQKGLYVFRAWRRCPKTGRILWARNYGYRAWRIPIE